MTITGDENGTYVNGSEIEGTENSFYGEKGKNDKGVGTVTVEGGTVDGTIYGGYDNNFWGDVSSGNKVIINGGTVNGTIYGGYARSQGAITTANDNTVELNGGKVTGTIYGGYSKENAGVSANTASNNTIILKGTDVSEATIYGGDAEGGIQKESNNRLVIDNDDTAIAIGGLYNLDGVEFTNLNIGQDRTITVGNAGGMDSVAVKLDKFTLAAGDVAAGTTIDTHISFAVKEGAITIGNIEQGEDFAKTDTYYTANRQSGGVLATKYKEVSVSKDEDNKGLTVSATVENSVLANTFIDEAGTSYTNGTFAIDNIFDAQVSNIAGIYDLSAKDDTDPGFTNTKIENAALTINGTVQNQFLYGAYSENKGVQQNEVTIGSQGIGYITSIYGGYSENSSANNNTVVVDAFTVDEANYIISGFALESNLYGGYSENGNAEDNTVLIKGYVGESSIYGGYSVNGDATGNTVHLEDGSMVSSNAIYGGYSENGSANNNTVIVGEGVTLTDSAVYGGWIGATSQGTATGNTLVIANSQEEMDIGELYNFDHITYDQMVLGQNKTFTAQRTTGMDDGVSLKVNHFALQGGDYSQNQTIDTTLTFTGVKVNDITLGDGAYDTTKYYVANREDNGVYVTKFSSVAGTVVDNAATITATVDHSILTGQFMDAEGTTYTNRAKTEGLSLGNGFTTNATVVAGVYGQDNKNADNGTVSLSGTINWNGTVYGGYSESGSANQNTIAIAEGTQGQDLTIKGTNGSGTGNTVRVDGMGSYIHEIDSVDEIHFTNVRVDSTRDYDPALTIDTGNLGDTKLVLDGLAGGQDLNVGDTFSLLGFTGETVTTGGTDYSSVTAGVSQDLELVPNEDGTGFTIVRKDINDQTFLLAENRAAATAFVNQGSDLVEGMMNVWGDNTSYGVQTYGIVQGGTNQYDVNSNIKLNGWETLVGVGNKKATAKGDVSWGVFYENGTADYRTFNTFNEESFNGDGSMTYTGAGLGLRLDKKNGFYAELGLRAGNLQSDMSAALKDANDNVYGYHSESHYYGGHIGVGKQYRLSSDESLDVYGKYFHTYTEGDSMVIDGDRFEFDGIQSDRVRVGVRYNKGTEVGLQMFYGVGYEYEFSGESQMRAAGLAAPEQSLQGSTYMGEIGFNYKETKDTPWYWGGTLTGYAGEREGVSANLHLGYKF